MIYDRHEHNCVHFAAKSWSVLTGEDILDELMSAFTGAPMAARRKAVPLDSLQDPCLVLFTKASGDRHLGVYNAGKVDHCDNTGPRRQPLKAASLGYKRVQFYGTVRNPD